jgi:hypothetical protein
MLQAVQNENLQNGQNEQIQAEDIICFKKIEEMENYGINRTDIIKLKAGGFNTIESLAHATLKKIQEVK